MRSARLLSWGWGAAALAWGCLARAHELDTETMGDNRSAAERGVGAEGRRPDGRSGGARGEEESEPAFTADLDLVLGWGNVPFAVQNLPSMGTQALTYTRSDDTPSRVQSFILAAGWKPSERLGLGVRLPFSFGSFSPAGSAVRSATSFGNVELEAEHPIALGDRVELALALGVALPTGQGDEIPEDLANAGAKTVDEDAYDRFSLSRAAAAARGYEDNALFEPRRLGFIPKVALTYRDGALSLEPYVKVENLVATSSALENKYVGELVPAARLGYRLGRIVEIALRGWANVGFAGGAEDTRVTVAVEPDVAVNAGLLRAYAGVIVPLAGPPADARFLAVRLGVAVAF